ncbi:hypothetical protein OK016_25630 [Vibrio chagasii]|nr:hypothetical protein [Vibrio chagasii]
MDFNIILGRLAINHPFEVVAPNRIDHWLCWWRYPLASVRKTQMFVVHRVAIAG